MEKVEFILDLTASIHLLLLDVQCSLNHRDFYHSAGKFTKKGFQETFCAFGEEDVIVEVEFGLFPKLVLLSYDFQLLSLIESSVFSKNYYHILTLKN